MIASLFASTAAKAIAVLALALILVGFVLWLKWDDAAQPKQDARSATAAAETAKAAARTVIDRSESDASIDELVAETSKEIENAETPEAAGDLARAAICRMPNYSADPACKLR